MGGPVNRFDASHGGDDFVGIEGVLHGHEVVKRPATLGHRWLLEHPKYTHVLQAGEAFGEPQGGVHWEGRHKDDVPHADHGGLESPTGVI